MPLPSQTGSPSPEPASVRGYLDSIKPSAGALDSQRVPSAVMVSQSVGYEVVDILRLAGVDVAGDVEVVVVLLDFGQGHPTAVAL